MGTKTDSYPSLTEIETQPTVRTSAELPRQAGDIRARSMRGGPSSVLCELPVSLHDSGCR
jgi:hypothetical protein